MVRPHVALPTGPRQSRNCYGTCVPRVARRAVADGSVVMRFADGMATRAPAGNRRGSFELRKRIRRPFHVAGMQLLCKIGLFGRKSFRPENCRPRRCRVAASHKFLIDLLMAHA